MKNPLYAILETLVRKWTMGNDHLDLDEELRKAFEELEEPEGPVGS